MSGGEEWRPVVGWPGYEVSNLGQVRSLTRRVGPGNRTIRGQILKCQLNVGYPSTLFSLGGVQRRILVHRIVLETFVGPCPEGMECRHLDGVRANANLSNLEWATHVVNCADQDRHGTRLRGERSPRSKLTDEKVRSIRRLHAEGVPRAELAKLHGVALEAVRCVILNLTWRHVR